VPPQVGQRVTEEGTTERGVSRRGKAKPESEMAEPLSGFWRRMQGGGSERETEERKQSGVNEKERRERERRHNGEETEETGSGREEREKGWVINAALNEERESERERRVKGEDFLWPRFAANRVAILFPLNPSDLILGTSILCYCNPSYSFV
jgi:hypothetical protein